MSTTPSVSPIASPSLASDSPAGPARVGRTSLHFDRVAAERKIRSVAQSFEDREDARREERARFAVAESEARYNEYFRSLKEHFAREAGEDFDEKRPELTFAAEYEARLREEMAERTPHKSKDAVDVFVAERVKEACEIYEELLSSRPADDSTAADRDAFARSAAFRAQPLLPYHGFKRLERRITRPSTPESVLVKA